MTAQEKHQQVVEEIARQYSAKGYTLEREPVLRSSHGEDLHADLIARHGNDTVLLEVRLTTPEQTAPALARLADYAQEKGWRFVIAVADARDIEEVQVPARSEILLKAAEARRLGPSSTAFGLLAWSVLEAAARFALARMGSTIRVSPPRTLVQQLAAHGLVTPAEEQELSALIEVRNRLAHGVWPTREPLPDFERALGIAEQLGAENGEWSNETSPSPNGSPGQSAARQKRRRNSRTNRGR